MGDFIAEFNQARPRLTRRLLKLECWQTYQEQPSNRSLAVYMAGDIESATALLAQEAEGDRPLYEEVQSKGLEFARIRLVTLPLTTYLEFEMINYEIRQAMGESIEVVLLDPGVSLPNNEFFDFLLFDDEIALVHDYGADGFQVGGWLVEEPDVVQRLEKIAVTVRHKSIPLAEFRGTATV